MSNDSPTEAPDLSSEHNASRKLARVTPKDESVKSASIHKLLNAIVWDAYEKGEAGASFGYPTYKERIQAALESAINEIIGLDTTIASIKSDSKALQYAAVRNALRKAQRNRLRSWIDGK